MVDASASLRSASVLLDDATRLSRSALRPRVTRLFDQGAGEAQMQRALTQAELAVQELRRGGGRGAQAADGVEQLVNDLRTVIQRRSFATARADTDVRFATGRLAIHRERVQLLDRLHHLDDAAARKHTDDLLDAITTRLDGGPHGDDSRQIAALLGLPAEVRPSLVGSRFDLREWERAGAVPRGNMWTTREQMLPDLRAGLERRQLATAPGATRESLTAELDRFLDRDPTTLGADELHRVALITGMPEGLRPAIVDSRLPYPLYHPAMYGSERGAKGPLMVLTANLEALRIERELATLRSVGALPTREAALGELAALLAPAAAEIDATALRRITTIARMSSDLGVPLPPQTTRTSIADAGAMTFRHAELPGRSMMIDEARTFYEVLRSPGEASRAARASIDAGETVDVVRLSALQHVPDELAAAGISEAMVGEQFARHLMRAGSTDMRAATLVNALETTRARVVTRVLDEQLEPLRAQTLELIDRNLARMNGTRTDTYGWHPDYAEVGRVASLARLFDEAAALKSGSSATAAATDGVERLTW